MGHYIGTPCMPVYSLYSDKTKNGLISKEVVTRFLRMFPKIFLKNTENGNSAGHNGQHWHSGRIFISIRLGDCCQIC